MSRADAVVTVDVLHARLRAEADRVGVDARLLLPAAAVAVLLLGVGQEGRRALMLAAADHPHPARICRQVIEAAHQSFRYLEGFTGHLTRFLDDGDSDASARALTGMLRVLADVDLEQISETSSVQGDVLGGLYTRVMAPGDRDARGAFYTPASLASVLALLVDVQPGERVGDPCAGCGGLIIAAVRSMRRGGRAPELVHWELGDIDGLALAIAGIQLAAHGVPSVVLRLGNALTPDRAPV